MSGFIRAIMALAAIASVAVMTSASAQTAPGAIAAPTPPTPPVVDKKPLVRQTPMPKLAARRPDPELDLRDTDTAKRVEGFVGDQPVGGADCRTQCAKAYYVCLSTDDSGGCAPTWTRCLTACPAHSSNF